MKEINKRKLLGYLKDLKEINLCITEMNKELLEGTDFKRNVTYNTIDLESKIKTVLGAQLVEETIRNAKMS